ncbi:MAG: hypothetical protein M0Z95_10400 [Actinomycetota bacterium]|jgi:pimeloyl-ACP methyl ester carboxylesterase|nr:hypothetical protein [Actinomycetota bacterium]
MPRAELTLSYDITGEGDPGCRYEEVPGCGHLGPLEDPGSVVSLLVDFFAGS